MKNHNNLSTGFYEKAVDLSGCIVTIDAMGCPKKEIAPQIVAQEADYVLALKGNQSGLFEDVQDLFAYAAEINFVDCDHHQTVEKDHGRLETRRYYQSTELDWFADRGQWEGLRSVGMVEAIREVGAERTVERRYYLASLPLGVTPFARAVRGHWSVENKLHWVLDVQMREDQSRARTGYAAENLATLRRLALNLLNPEQTKKRGVKGKQLNAAWNHDAARRCQSNEFWLRGEQAGTGRSQRQAHARGRDAV